MKLSDRCSGVLLPAFSPRRAGDLGIGDTRALLEWVEWAALYKVGFLQLLPINETGADCSPYNAISSVALEPLYLTMEVEEIPGLVAEDLVEARAELGEDVLAARFVEYARVREVKLRLLRRAFERFTAEEFAEEKAEFRAFVDAEASWLNDYAFFRELMCLAGERESWHLWPDAFNEPRKAREYLAELRAAGDARLWQGIEFRRWVQWLCFRQWRAVRARAQELGVKLMGDIPIGIAYDSADVFFQRENFDLDWCGGAPPETMFKHDRFIQRWGQNWGIPLYRWEDMERMGYPWWRQRIEKLTEVFAIFRIDHILGFYRIYAFPWRPQRNGEFLDLSEEEARERCGGKLPGWAWRADDTEENRQANRADGDRRLRMILAAAGDGEVVGEDLGCVPEYVRPHLESLGIAGFRIPHWDHRDGHVVPGSEYPECSFATYSTHDHDTLAALWEGYRQAALGLVPVEDHEKNDALWNLRLLSQFAGMTVGEDEVAAFSPSVQWSLIDGLMRCHSRYAAIMITDLFGMHDRYNRPGTVGGENWRFRLPFSMAEIMADDGLRGQCERLRESIEKSGR